MTVINVYDGAMPLHERLEISARLDALIDGFAGITQSLQRIETKVEALQTAGAAAKVAREELMATVAEAMAKLKAEVEEAKGARASVRVLVQGLKDEVKRLADQGGASASELEAMAATLDADNLADAAMVNGGGTNPNPPNEV